jgi:DNA-binding CsgD family transcriptional regulator/tetratricopeptide (TPR) repeat protein
VTDLVLAPGPPGASTLPSASRSITTIPPVKLLERDDDLAALGASLARARQGRGSLSIICGEPGAGKSTLLQAFADDSARGLPVLWGACDPLSTPRPLGPIHDLATELGEHVVAVLDGASQPHEIYAAVFDHLRQHPSVLIVDDLHWADQGTIDLLRFLLRRIRVTGSLVLGAMRDEEVDASHPLRSLLGDVARSPDAETTTLQPLSVEAITALADERSVDAGWLHRLTGGNPFFVVEMLAHDGDEIPRTVRDAVLARTAGLEPDAWDLLHLLACSPEAIPDHLLPALSIGLPTLRAVDQAGLVRRGRRGVAFRHDLCRTTIMETLPPGGEATFHRRMLDVLEASPNADPAVLTHHALGAGDAPRTLRHATAGGRAASRSGAHSQAASFFRIALAQGVPDGAADEAELLELLAYECYLIDRLDEAISSSRRAMHLREQLHDVVGVSTSHHALSVYHWYNADRGLADRHADAAEEVLVAGSQPLPADAVVRLGHALAMQAYLAVQNNDIDRARQLLTRASAAVEGTGDAQIATRIRVITGVCDVVEGTRGSREETLTMLGAALAHFDEIYSSGYSNLTYLDVEQRRLRSAGELLGFTLPLTTERDLPICRVWQLGSRSRMKLLNGDWDDALADADAVLAGPSAPLARTWPYLIRALIALRQGIEADADLDEAWELACRFAEPIRLFPAAAALAERSWLTGTADPRVDESRALLSTATGGGLEWARGELAVWLRRLDVASGAGRRAELELGDVAEPYRLQLAGRFTEAADMWARLSSPYDQALALLDAGSPDNVRAGLDMLDRLGADRVADKVRQDLRRMGAGSVPSRRRRRTLANPAGLTARQVEILGLLRDGCTNAEIGRQLFISTKTVDHHVSALLLKLGVATRHAAVRRSTELGIIG